MMNRNIDILNIKKIYAHQLFNKDILLMKKESKDRHHFSFGEYYDEILLSGYPIEIQSYMLPIHQIIVFSLITKSPVNYTMNIQEAKAIRLADYLQSLGYSPVKQQGNSLWYKSPFREESEPSFKVNTGLNQWFDFGLGKGGNILALVRELYQEDFSKPKIVWGNLNLTASYAMVQDNSFINAPSPVIVPASKFLLAVLNSKLADYYIRQLGVTRNGGYFEYKPMFVEKLPVPQNADTKAVTDIESYVDSKNETAIDKAVYMLYGLTEEETLYIDKKGR